MVGRLSLHHRRGRDGRGRRWSGAKACASAARGVPAAAFLGFTQFCVNFNAVYLAERYITSGAGRDGVRAAAHPQQPARLGVARAEAGRALRSGLAGRGRAASPCCSRMSCASIPARSTAILIGIGLTLVGMLGASSPTSSRRGPKVRHIAAVRLLAWSMATGAVIDAVDRLAVAGPAGVRPASPPIGSGLLYLALLASALAFSLYLSGGAADRPGARRPIRACWCRSSPWAFRPGSKIIAGPR